MLHIHVAVSPPGHVRDSNVTATDNCAGAVVTLAVMCVCVCVCACVRVCACLAECAQFNKVWRLACHNERH